ncbi:hypothetical protein [Marinomonas polaris]|uniref:Cap15 family cyclic dinucleotide receptor domain-containing protein n=1 Tax=Marinomonas polaris TaxID=293552 RepID=UPI003F97EC7B
MYQSLGIKNLLTGFAGIALSIFFIVYFSSQPSSLFELIKKMSLSITIASSLVLILGQTKAFPLLCRLPIVRDFFPPIDGDWLVTINSNWGVIEKRERNNEITDNILVLGKAKIKSRFLKVSISFSSDSEYSSSKTVCVSVNRDPDDSTVTLNYIYENRTDTPDLNDSSFHNGAARVTIYNKASSIFSMKGVYWTNRNWNNGLNTAGSISYTKI